MTAPHDESLPTDKQLRLKRAALSPNKEASEQTGGDDGELRPILGGECSAEVNEKICNLEREYRDCIKSRRDKIGITRHIMMHQVLYIVQLPNEEGDMHII